MQRTHHTIHSRKAINIIRWLEVDVYREQFQYQFKNGHAIMLSYDEGRSQIALETPKLTASDDGLEGLLH